MKPGTGVQRLRGRPAAPGSFWPESAGHPGELPESPSVAEGAFAGSDSFAHDEAFERLHSDLQSAQDALERCLRQHGAPADPIAWRLRVQDLQHTVRDRYGALCEYLRLLRRGVQEI